MASVLADVRYPHPPTLLLHTQKVDRLQRPVRISMVHTTGVTHLQGALCVNSTSMSIQGNLKADSIQGVLLYALRLGQPRAGSGQGPALDKYHSTGFGSRISPRGLEVLPASVPSTCPPGTASIPSLA